MEEDLETRLATLERRLGLQPSGGPRQPSDVDPNFLASQMRERGFGRVFSLDVNKLRRLQKVLHESVFEFFSSCFSGDHRPLNDKLAAVQFEENLIRQRAELIEEFEKQIKSEAIPALPSHEAAVEQITDDITKALGAWKVGLSDDIDDEIQDHVDGIEAFRGEYATLMAGLQNQISELSAQVAAAEARASNA